MKKVISALTAATMVASMSASVMSAFAEYSAADMEYALRVNPECYYTVSGDAITYHEQTAKFEVSADGSTITFASAADAAGAKFAVDAFLIADASAPTVEQLGGTVKSTSKSVHFERLGVSYTDAAEGAPTKEYTKKDGKTFKTDVFVNTFASAGVTGKFADNTGSAEFGYSGDWPADWNYAGDELFIWLWAGKQGVELPYLGEKSDDYPVAEFSVSLDDNIADGTYTIEFQEEYLHGEYGNMHGTFVNSNGKDAVTPGKLSGLTIIVGNGSEPDTSEPKPTEEEPDTSEPKPTEEEPDTTEPKEDDNKHDKGYEWDIEEVNFDPEADEYIEVPINVYNDAGTYGIQFGILVDGKSAEDPDFPFVLAEINKGEAYKYKDFVVNEAKGSVASSLNGEDSQYAENGATAVYLVFLPKDGVDYAPGTRYKITFGSTDPAKEMKFAGFDGVPYTDITLSAGAIIIPGGAIEPDTSEPDEPDTTDIEEPDTSEQTPDTSEQTPDTSDQGGDKPGDYLYGDVNKNGKVELVDIVMLNRFLTKYDNQTLDDYQIEVANCADNTTPGKSTAADLNGTDSVEILKYLIGLVSKLGPNA